MTTRSASEGAPTACGALAVVAATCALTLGLPTIAGAAPSEPQPLTIAACTADPLVLPQDTETALDATLLLSTPRGQGSAVLISPDGFALTAAHVVKGGAPIVATLHNGQTRVAAVVRVDHEQDIALIKIESDGAGACSPAAERPAALGADAFVLGSPGGTELSFSVAKGIVSARRDFEGVHFLQLDASINPGNSGGPVLDSAGKLIGIASWKIADVTVEGLGFAVPSDVALSALQLHWGTVTDSDWQTRAVAPVAEPDALASLQTGVSPEVRRRLTVRRALIASGASLLGTGVVTLVVTAILGRKSGPEIAPAQWSTLTRINTVGWVAAGTGAAMLGAGLLVRRSPKRANFTLAPHATGISVQGRF